MSIAHQTSVPAQYRRSCRVAHQADGVRAGLAVFGLLQVAVGLLMAIDPGTLLGPLASSGDHYGRDLATVELPLGLALLVAVRLKGWRVPVLALAALHWSLLALTHVLSLDGTAPLWPSLGYIVLLAVGAVSLTWLLARAIRAERWGSP